MWLLVALLKDVEGFYFLIGMTGAKGMVTCVRPKTKKIQLRRLPRVLWLRASWALVWRVNPESCMFFQSL